MLFDLSKIFDLSKNFAFPDTMLKSKNYFTFKTFLVICKLGDSGFFLTSRYQGIVKATHSGVFEDLKFKISEGSDQN
jgi:hypothetical protein